MKGANLTNLFPYLFSVVFYRLSIYFLNYLFIYLFFDIVIGMIFVLITFLKSSL